MAKILSKSGIGTGTTVQAGHVTQSIDAFTGTDAYDITLSGSLVVTGSITGQPGVVNALTASYAVQALTEITKEVSSSHANFADTASFALGLSGTPSITTSLVTTTNLITTNLTASGNISSSGTIIASNLSGTNTGDQNISNLAVTGSDVIFNHITASGNISSSGNIIGNNLTTIGNITSGGTGSFNHLLSPAISSSRIITTNTITAGTSIGAGTSITAATFIGDGSSITNLQRPITSSLGNVSASNANAGFYFRLDGSVTVSIQSGSVVACDIGNEFEFFQTSSAGAVLFKTGSNGVTLNSKGTNISLAGQFSGATLKKIASDPDEWDLIGDLG
tara:strand:- start:6 stop:1010 length:1005 start_codon:yes stop_codon:yes gene_type:complete